MADPSNVVREQRPWATVIYVFLLCLWILLVIFSFLNSLERSGSPVVSSSFDNRKPIPLPYALLCTPEEFVQSQYQVDDFYWRCPLLTNTTIKVKDVPPTDPDVLIPNTKDNLIFLTAEKARVAGEQADLLSETDSAVKQCSVEPVDFQGTCIGFQLQSHHVLQKVKTDDRWTPTVSFQLLLQRNLADNVSAPSLACRSSSTSLGQKCDQLVLRLGADRESAANSHASRVHLLVNTASTVRLWPRILSRFGFLGVGGRREDATYEVRSVFTTSANVASPSVDSVVINLEFGSGVEYAAEQDPWLDFISSLGGFWTGVLGIFTFLFVKDAEPDLTLTSVKRLIGIDPEDLLDGFNPGDMLKHPAALLKRWRRISSNEEHTENEGPARRSGG